MNKSLKTNRRAQRFAVILLFIVASFSARAQTLMYEQTEVMRVSGIKNDSMVYSLSVQQKQVSRVFLDGLERPVQQTMVKGSPTQKDLVQVMVYDNLGRQTTGYLPYAGTTGTGDYRPSALTEQSAFYRNGTADKVADDTSAYTRQLFENSPLQRLLSVGMVGMGFQPTAGQRYKSVTYRANRSAADGNIIKWGPDAANNGNYADSLLSVTEGTDEDSHKTLTFTDQNGHLVLKRLQADAVIGGATVTYFDTYYIYNNAGAVAYIVPPKATSLIKAGSLITASPVANLLFRFYYDNQGRVVRKKIPTTGEVWIIYDPLSRPVLIQDANLRAGNKWNYIKYDAKGRAISQGIYTDNTRTTLASMQAYVNGLTGYNTTWYETRNNNSGTGYYSNNVFPTSAIDPLAYSYFEDYDLDRDGTANFTYSAQGLPGEMTPTNLLRGALTMTRRRTVGPGLSDAWLIQAMFYDKFGRVVQTQGNNQLRATVNDLSTLVPDFTGNTLQAKEIKVVGAGGASNTTTTLSSYSYDHMSRVLAIDQQYNAGTTLRIAAFEYNELGQVIKKNLGATGAAATPADRTLGTAQSVASGNTSIVTAPNSITLTPDFQAAQGSVFSASILKPWLQSVDYRYNIRGQLTSINNSRLTNDGVLNTDDNDVFGMELLYNLADANLGNTVSYTGKISGVKWMSTDAANNRGAERSFRYNYDKVNRLTDALYAERGAVPTGAFNQNVNGYNESGISYDENGNILTLKRTNAFLAGAAVNKGIDSLTYTYDTNNANQLFKIADGTGALYTQNGFRNLTGATSAANYAYETNGSGNLKTDPYKGLEHTYNILNRTEKITVTTATNRYVDYTYDATGTLLRKRQYNSGTLQSTTDYVGSFVYTTVSSTTTLAYFANPTGRVRNNGGTLVNEYTITDQQGNARVSFDNGGTGGSARMIQENSYYAFGLIMAGSAVATPAIPNRELYNGGSEWQNELPDALPDYYQTFYRNYDPATGRFVAADPMAEASESLSIYQYSENNPVMFNDPLGDLSSAYGRIVQEMYQRNSYSLESMRVADETQNYYFSQAERFFSTMGYGSYNLDSYGSQTIFDVNKEASNTNLSLERVQGLLSSVGKAGFSSQGYMYEYTEGSLYYDEDLQREGILGTGKFGYIGPVNQGGIVGDAYIGGFYNSKKIGNSYSGNISGLGFDAVITTMYSSGERYVTKIPVRFNEASFHITRFSTDNQSISSIIFSIAYNSALSELKAYLKTGLSPNEVNPEMDLSKDFKNLININLNLIRPGSGFNSYYLKNVPVTSATYFP